MIYNRKSLVLLTVILLLILPLMGCSSDEEVVSGDLFSMEWSEIESASEGTQVNFYMWGGDERINNWIDTFAASNLKKDYGIELNRVPMGPNDYLNQLLGEKQVGLEEGSIDLLWINGENFQVAKESGLLFGPFVDIVPNYEAYMDTESLEIITDFGYPTEGYELPYGKAQFTFTYDQARTEDPPYTFDELIQWIKDNPGKFTYPDPVSNFTGSVFVRHIIYEMTGGYEAYHQIEDEEEIREMIRPAMELLRDLKPYLWREGQTYPATTAQLNNMFVDGELMATMAYSSILTSGEIASGNFPETARTFVLENGTIANTHFLAIPFNSPNKAGALVAANFLAGFEAQVSKFDPQIWGDMPIFSYEKLSDEEKAIVDSIDTGIATLSQETLDSHSVPEMPARFVPIIEEEWDRIVNR
ncbi:ABC transporter substrate-binding protein [Halonatronum saccharophilum]|uniref:ABC transporter substrate-binding protein n=1 Tax=Halonatronum saccharophilum TaxID=150060 RepID=UPI0004B12929|nr:ABC transporter substrate-binding protein [Halonatronum saccharophilum]